MADRKTGNLTPEIALGMLQEDLANLDRLGVPIWAGQIEWNGQKTVIILVQGVRLHQEDDGTVSLALEPGPIQDVDKLIQGLQETAPPEARHKTADEILAAASVPPEGGE